MYRPPEQQTPISERLKEWDRAAAESNQLIGRSRTEEAKQNKSWIEEFLRGLGVGGDEEE